METGIGPLRGFTDMLGESAVAGADTAAAFIDGGEAVRIFGERAGFSQESMGKIAAAMGTLGLAVGAVQTIYGMATEQRKKFEAWDNEAIDGLTSAMIEHGDRVTALTSYWDELGDIQANVFGETMSLTEGLADMGLTVTDVADAVAGGDEAVDAFTAELEAAGTSADDAALLNLALKDAVDQLDQAADGAEAHIRVFGDSTEEAGDQADDATKAVEELEGALEDLPEETVSDVDVDLDEQAVAAADRAIDEAARDRTATIYVDTVAGGNAPPIILRRLRRLHNNQRQHGPHIRHARRRPGRGTVAAPERHIDGRGMTDWWLEDPPFVPDPGCPLIDGWRIVIEILDAVNETGWIDVTGDIQSVDVVTGDRVDSWTVPIDEFTVNIYDPDLDVWTIHPDVDPTGLLPTIGTRIRVGVLDEDGPVYMPLATGSIDRIEMIYGDPTAAGLLTVDAFGIAAELNQIERRFSRPVEQSGPRIDAIMAAADYSWAPITVAHTVTNLVALPKQRIEIRTLLDDTAISSNQTLQFTGRGEPEMVEWPFVTFGDGTWRYDTTAFQGALGQETVLYLGTRFTPPESGWVSKLRWQIPVIHADVHYDLWLHTAASGTVLMASDLPKTVTDEWLTYSFEPVDLQAAETVTAVLAIRNQSTSFALGPHGWDYSTPNNPAAPVPGQIVHDNKTTGRLLVHRQGRNFGSGALEDRTAVLDQVSPGDVIDTEGEQTWTVTAVAVVVDVYDFTVTPAVQAPGVDRLREFTFTIFDTGPIDYSYDPLQWQGQTVTKGVSGTDLAALVEGDDGFPVDIFFLPISEVNSIMLISDCPTDPDTLQASNIVYRADTDQIVNTLTLDQYVDPAVGGDPAKTATSKNQTSIDRYGRREQGAGMPLPPQWTSAQSTLDTRAQTIVNRFAGTVHRVASVDVDSTADRRGDPVNNRWRQLVTTRRGDPMLVQRTGVDPAQFTGQMIGIEHRLEPGRWRATVFMSTIEQQL